jgi:hypothetical protein
MRNRDVASITFDMTTLEEDTFLNGAAGTIPAAGAVNHDSIAVVAGVSPVGPSAQVLRGASDADRRLWKSRWFWRALRRAFWRRPEPLCYNDLCPDHSPEAFIRKYGLARLERYEARRRDIAWSQWLQNRRPIARALPVIRGGGDDESSFPMEDFPPPSTGAGGTDDPGDSPYGNLEQPAYDLPGQAGTRGGGGGFGGGGGYMPDPKASPSTTRVGPRIPFSYATPGGMLGMPTVTLHPFGVGQPQARVLNSQRNLQTPRTVPTRTFPPPQLGTVTIDAVGMLDDGVGTITGFASRVIQEPVDVTRVLMAAGFGENRKGRYGDWSEARTFQRVDGNTWSGMFLPMSFDEFQEQVGIQGWADLYEDQGIWQYRPRRRRAPVYTIDKRILMNAQPRFSVPTMRELSTVLEVRYGLPPDTNGTFTLSTSPYIARFGSLRGRQLNLEWITSTTLAKKIAQRWYGRWDRPWMTVTMLLPPEAAFLQKTDQILVDTPLMNALVPSSVVFEIRGLYYHFNEGLIEVIAIETDPINLQDTQLLAEAFLAHVTGHSVPSTETQPLAESLARTILQAPLAESQELLEVLITRPSITGDAGVAIVEPQRTEDILTRLITRAADVSDSEAQAETLRRASAQVIAETQAVAETLSRLVIRAPVPETATPTETFSSIPGPDVEPGFEDDFALDAGTHESQRFADDFGRGDAGDLGDNWALMDNYFAGSGDPASTTDLQIVGAAARPGGDGPALSADVLSDHFAMGDAMWGELDIKTLASDPSNDGFVGLYLRCEPFGTRWTGYEFRAHNDGGSVRSEILVWPGGRPAVSLASENTIAWAAGNILRAEVLLDGTLRLLRSTDGGTSFTEILSTTDPDTTYPTADTAVGVSAAVLGSGLAANVEIDAVRYGNLRTVDQTKWTDYVYDATLDQVYAGHEIDPDGMARQAHSNETGSDETISIFTPPGVLTDQFVELTIGSLEPTDGSFYAVLRAGLPGDGVDYYAIHFTISGSGLVDIFLRNATYAFGATGPTGIAVAIGDVLRAEVRGSGGSLEFRVYVNAGLVWTAGVADFFGDDPAMASGYGGMSCFNFSSATVFNKLSHFKCGAL